MPAYDSDASTLVGGQHTHRPRHRPETRSRSPTRNDSAQPDANRAHPSYFSPGFDEHTAKYVKIGGVVLVAGIVGVLLHKWQKDREERREREYRHQRGREFEKAKRARRTEEERREREEEELAGGTSAPAAVRRIEYRAVDRTQSNSNSSSSGSRRRAEPASGRGERRGRSSGYDARYDDGRRSRSRAY
ncbi:hypothetical protein BDY17DRAFT_292831 [Neohortaea acidophila]|uniref:Uncharacterized protein n=1 Tax=Neohortaea acidophila TaxID=245834 RepID=A0A6A6PZ50_9PEZI|nr:uncharacterized protein BDY17DRAFT_292831 [Neohortaea acidophila]KAF2485046.1 hypothetical protein BDY17DRAFT_292831 [Neohortaea acidophila]